MPVFISLAKKDLAHLSDKFIFDEISHLKNLTSSFEAQIPISSEIRHRLKDFALQLVQDIEGDGQNIPKQQADDMRDNFSIPHQFYPITRQQIESFIQFADSFNKIPQGFSIGIRFYVGKQTLQSKFYHIIALPICSPDPDPITNIRDHTRDLEKTFFNDNQKVFSALNISTGNSINVIKDAKALITAKDGTIINPSPGVKEPTEVVFFSLANLKKFYSSLTNNEVRFYFARVAPKDSLSIVIEGTEAVLVYFDQGDLMPPPPVNDSFLS